MNMAEVLKRLRHERKQWRYDQITTHGREMTWVIYGLDIAIRLIYDVIKESKAQAKIKRPYISRWLAPDLAHAIDIALRALKRSDRKKAIEVLQKAQNLVKQKESGL